MARGYSPHVLSGEGDKTPGEEGPQFYSVGMRVVPGACPKECVN